MDEAKEAAVYVLANWIEEARTNITENEKVYIDSYEALVNRLNTYEGISKLEDDSYRFASKLRESEENLKNDLGGRSFFKKEMDIGKYWDARVLGEFGDFESVVGTNYGKFIGDVYAKLDKKGDVSVSRKEKVGIVEGIWTGSLYVLSGGTGALGGGMFGAIIGRLVAGVPVELSSSFVITGAVAGWIGASGLAYSFVRGANTFTNLFSDGADNLEKRIGVIREALDCRGE